MLRTLFAEYRGRRIITASFASHLHRIQQIADAAIESGRKVATLGMSMRKNVQLGIDLGIVSIPASELIDIEDIDRYPPGEVCVISTGSQGEPMSALALLARGENKFVKLTENDTVILSSHAIPGNERNVNRVMDGLLRAGAQVVHSGIARRARHRPRPGRRAEDVPVDRPAGVVRADPRRVPPPRWPTPSSAQTMGVPRDRVLVCEDGDVLVVSDDGVEVAGRVPAGYLYVDGIVGDVGHGVLRDRAVLASEGVVVVVVTVDTQTGKVLTGPEIITRGWVYAPEAEDLLDEACDTIADGRRGRPGQGRARRRGARARRAPGRRPVRLRAHPPPPDDRPRRDGGVTPPPSERRRLVRELGARRLELGATPSSGWTLRPGQPWLATLNAGMATWGPSKKREQQAPCRRRARRARRSPRTAASTKGVRQPQRHPGPLHRRRAGTPAGHAGGSRRPASCAGRSPGASTSSSACS